MVNRDDQNGRWIVLINSIVRTELCKKKEYNCEWMIHADEQITYTRSCGNLAESFEQRIGTSPRSVATQAEPQLFNWCKQYPP